MTLKYESPITEAAKRIIRLIDSGYLTDNFRRDIEILMQGALAYEVVTKQDGNALPSSEGKV